jgi:hypothetical protein
MSRREPENDERPRCSGGHDSSPVSSRSAERTASTSACVLP